MYICYYLGGPDRLAASEARARSRGASPSRAGRHQHHIHVHGPINSHVNVGQPSKYFFFRQRTSYW